MSTLKVNTLMFYWSDFVHNYMTLSRTSGFHFVGISNLMPLCNRLINSHIRQRVSGKMRDV